MLNMFTEMTSNELSRTFTYRCLLMPKECKKEISSFGNEMRARAEMKKHVYEHLSDLEKEGINSFTNFHRILETVISGSSIYTHFNTLKKKTLRNHYG